MSGSSTPKRHLSEFADVQYALGAKRNRHNAYSSPSEGLLPLPRSPYTNASIASTQELNEPQERSRINNAELNVTSESQSTAREAHASQEQICFGMLKGIEIQLGFMSQAFPAALETVQSGDDIFACLELVFNYSRCDIQTKDGTHVATINTKFHVSIRRACFTDDVEYKALVLLSDIKQQAANTTAQRIRTRAPRQCCHTNIHIFGSRQIAAKVGRQLSRERLFLQHPSPVLHGATYNNPQYLTLIGGALPNGALLPSLSNVTLTDESTDCPTPETNGKPAPFELPDLISVMNELPEHEYLENVAIDDRIITPLYSHQLAAVAFITHRESRSITKPRSLWSNGSSDSDSRSYRHKITGIRDELPRDIPGGILADDMGLGKTLTMIAAIMSTLPHAERFASEVPRQRDSSSFAPLISVKTTLVVVPSALLLDGWLEEINKRVLSGSLQVYKYYSLNRRLPISSTFPYHIILTTYQVLAAEHARGGGALRQFHWYRIILDEAHSIRNSTTKMFKAITALSANIRWCISGTPVQNSLLDLLSLVKFLQLPLLSDSFTFHKHISGSPIKGTKFRSPNYDNLRMLLGSICLRRSISTIIAAEEISYVTHRPRLSSIEQQYYDKIAIVCQELTLAAINSPRRKHRVQSLFTAILMLRIFCNTGLTSTLTLENLAKQCLPDESLSLQLLTGVAVCMECKGEMSSQRTTYTAEKDHILHRFLCHRCLPRTVAPSPDGTPHGAQSTESNQDGGPIQEAEHTMELDTSQNSFPYQHGSPYPSKLLVLLGDIKKYYQQDKSIVFSFWKRSLHLVGRLFQEEDVSYSLIDGDVETTRRKKILEQFHADPSVRVLLITLGTGAVGLNNLTVASRIHILEPQWNPAAESQAIGRVVRIGQKVRVSVIRYVVHDSIEVAVESRQLKKAMLAVNGGLQSSRQDVTANEIRAGGLAQLMEIFKSTTSTVNKS
ncbi:hypothetical protein VHEMI09098 [[Torrubiella] hemipterigena]|uniref:Uncharacterized protein n=1 Tax=[Torrubiella] hemipterigena TaxID=1531966 RepID=A0A0A1TQV9_9HYPO|nr:hypothetical protein VHEMI09098 [[Torrubiella] hemipterigena]